MKIKNYNLTISLMIIVILLLTFLACEKATEVTSPLAQNLANRISADLISSKIIFASGNKSEQALDIYSINEDGTQLVNLTSSSYKF